MRVWEWRTPTGCYNNHENEKKFSPSQFIAKHKKKEVTFSGALMGRHHWE
jgi:hypothetical protein